MENRSNFILALVVVAIITGGIVGVMTAPVTAQASGNGSNDTEFDEPSSNTTFNEPSNNTTFNNPSNVSENVSINSSSSYLNTNITYKAPGNITEGGLINNSTSGAGVKAPEKSGGKAGSCGSLLDAILGDKEIIGILGCILKGTIIDIFFKGFMDLVQGIFNAVVNAIFSTPVPKVNGDPAFFVKPTNAPWGVLWETAMFTMVPIGLMIWATLFLGSYGVISILPLGAFAEQKRRKLQNRAVLAFVGVIGAWGMGAIFLWMTQGFTQAIVPHGDQIASNGVLLMANVRSSLITIFALYLSSGVLAVYFMILVILRYLIALIFMIALPVAIPFIMIDAGPFRYMSNVVERFIDTCIIFIMMVIPMGLVLRGGYGVVNAINKSQLEDGSISNTIFELANESGLLIFVTWVLAALTPIFLFREMGQVKGIASSALQMGQKAHDRYQELTEREDTDTGETGPDGLNDRARDYEPWMVNNAKPTEFGGELTDGWVRGEDGQTEPAGMLGRGPGMLANPSDPHASPDPNRLDAGHPAAGALPSGGGNVNSQAASGGGRWSQFTNWMGGTRDNLGDRINNAQEMGDTARENSGGFVGGIAGATAGFFGGGSGSEKTGQDTTTSTTDTGTGTAQDTTTSTTRDESTSCSTTGTSERTTRTQNMQGGAEDQSQSSEDVGGYREEKGRSIFVPQSTAGLPSHMDIGPITSEGFQKTSEGTETDTVIDNFSDMEDTYREQGDVFVARDQESGQLYDLSNVNPDQEPQERDRSAEERAKRSARDVENAREEADD
jgi:gas vesicle protein